VVERVCVKESEENKGKDRRENKKKTKRKRENERKRPIFCWFGFNGET
jgi:hypothetical protein